MKIGDRVTYNDEEVTFTDVLGTIAEPTAEEFADVEKHTREAMGPEFGDVFVVWDDGDRFWEHPSYLVVVREAGS